MLDLDRALTDLAALDEEQAAMFEARYLLGCSVEETAELFATYLRAEGIDGHLGFVHGGRRSDHDKGWFVPVAGCEGEGSSGDEERGKGIHEGRGGAAHDATVHWRIRG